MKKCMEKINSKCFCMLLSFIFLSAAPSKKNPTLLEQVLLKKELLGLRKNSKMTIECFVDKKIPLQWDSASLYNALQTIGTFIKDHDIPHYKELCDKATLPLTDECIFKNKNEDLFSWILDLCVINDSLLSNQEERNIRHLFRHYETATVQITEVCERALFELIKAFSVMIIGMQNYKLFLLEKKQLDNAKIELIQKIELCCINAIIFYAKYQ